MLFAIRRALIRIGVMTTRPAAFSVVFAYVVAWLVFLPLHSDGLLSQRSRLG